MNSFILWTHAHHDLIIFATIALSSLAGYWTHSDIHKYEILELKREIWDLEEQIFSEVAPYMSLPDKEGNTTWITDYSQIGGNRP